jgi:hypothetical protein
MIWLATQGSHHDLAIFPVTVDSGTESHPREVRRGPVLLPGYIVHIQLHNEVHVARWLT